MDLIPLFHFQKCIYTKKTTNFYTSTNVYHCSGKIISCNCDAIHPCFFFWRDPIPSSPEDRNQCTSMANTLVVYARLYYDFWPKGLRRGSDFLIFLWKLWCFGGGGPGFGENLFHAFLRWFSLKENVTSESWNWIILDLPLVRKTCSNTWGMGHHEIGGTFVDGTSQRCT